MLVKCKTAPAIAASDVMIARALLPRTSSEIELDRKLKLASCICS